MQGKRIINKNPIFWLPVTVARFWTTPRSFAPTLRKSIYNAFALNLRNGKYGLIEIKLGGDKLIEEGAKSLKSMAAKIDTDKMNAPSFLMVLTGTGDYAYCRQDGVCVVPIGCLKNWNATFPVSTWFPSILKQRPYEESLSALSKRVMISLPGFCQ